MHRFFFWFGVVYLLYISKEIYAIECPDDSDFICSNDTKCIPSSKVCDKVKDCTDGSDEEDCDCLAPDWYLCQDNITCLSHSQVCDGSFDCPIHEDDEKNCTGSYVPHHEKPECSQDEFTCISDGFCLALEMACDGVKQCMDGSDEKAGCSVVSKRCQGFVCKNGRCLTDTDWVCDRHNDCGDNSDEPQNCTYNCKLSEERFLCNDNSSCIPLNKVCDGKVDCPKGDDESSTCNFAKEECETNRCPKEAVCHSLPTGSVCICPEGYDFNATSEKCEDVDECLTYGICSHGCHNYQGTYQCICSPRFELASDNQTCTPLSLKDAILVYAASSSVYAMTLNSHHIHRVADNLNQVVGICYNAGYIYWTDISKQVESVMRSKILGRPETVFTSGLGKPEDITVDHITGNIYFSDYDHQHIAVCSNDARYCKALITVNVHRPRGVVLHTLNGQIFWSDWGAKPMIGIASMDGKSAKPFISKDIHWPNGLALDWPNKRLYWVDAKLKLIESCKLDGSDRRAVTKHVLKHPYGIAVFEDKLYWSDWNTKSIQSCNKFTGKNRTTVIRDKMIYDIHIYHPAMQGFRENPCEKASCTHLCLLNANATYTCECPKYWELSSDNHTCIPTEKRKTLLVGMGNRFILMEHQAFGRHNDAEGKIVQINIDKMAYNSLKGNVLVADNKDKVIYEVEPKTFASRKLLTDNIENITAMAFDNFANTLYWTDAERSTIEVYSFNTQHRAIVHHFMGGQKPIGLAIVPEKGKLYVALRTKTHTYIDMMPSNGRGTHYHFLKDEMGEGPVNMLPDPNLEEIFMTDYEHSSIKYMSFSGNTYHTFLHDVDTPASLAIVGDELFWSTSKSLVLNWTPTHSMTGTKSMVIQHPKTLPVPDVMVLQTITTVKMSKHPCIAHKNNGCSHLCVAMSASIPSCLCPNGMVFNNSSNTTCINSRECFFRCGSGECISEAEHCNSKNDCADHSDELNCDKKKTINCLPNDFICADNSKCIDRNSRCDKKFDCDDQSDEAGCDKYNPKSKCHERQFMCYDGTCITQERLCDGFKDCAKREDELKETCETYGTCTPDEFRCDNGQCIMDSWVCDEDFDCNDNSDERHCTFTVECVTDFRKCDDGSCLHKNVWCDGHNDCDDLSDERNCTLAKEVKKPNETKELKCDDPNKFQCKSDKVICLEDSQLCNGKAECPNGEDEGNCPECTKNQFKCEKNECIPMEKRCNNHTDCKNGKDELDCDQIVKNSFHIEKDVSRSMGDILMIFALVILTIIFACAVIKLGIVAYQKYQANAAANLIVHFKNGTADITTMTALNASDDTIKLLP